MPARGQPPPSLDLCRACNSYIWPGEQDCPHCGADVAAAAAGHAEDVARRAALIAEVEHQLAAIRATRTADVDG